MSIQYLPGIAAIAAIIAATAATYVAVNIHWLLRRMEALEASKH